MSKKKQLGWGLVLSIVVLVGAIAIPVLINYGISYSMSRSPRAYITGASITLPLLAISGVVGLLAMLTVVSVAFSAIGLSNEDYALGLPEGSVRAVIAIGLVVIFVIVSIFLFGEIEGDKVISRGIPKDQINSLTGEILSISCEEDDEGVSVCNVVTKVDKTEASQDFAKQILTTVSTLVVAVAGFYFGTRAVSTAKSVVLPSSPVIRSIKQTEGTKGEKLEVEIFGKNFQLLQVVKFIKDSEEIQGTEVTWSPTKINCKINLADRPTGKYDLIVINEDGGDDRLADAFEVKDSTKS